MKHRNIVPILHTSLDGDDPWYLMPVAITSLDKELEKDRLVGGHYKSAILDIILGLEELHSMQMYHRDLKPPNVLKFEDDDGEVFYAISDFGFVSLKDSRLSKLTVTGMAKGTDYYTAPEITKNLGNASPQSDIYSLGCIIHDMIGTEDRVPCGEIREKSDFSALLLNCTRGRPDRRFKSVATVGDVLLSIDESLPPAKGKEAISFSETLDSDNELSSSNVSKLAEYLEDNSGDEDAIIILRKITIDRIAEAWNCNSKDTRRIGLVFAEWVLSNSFDFDYCDVLANRLAKFIENGDFDLQSECILALLKMGTSHNRWFVEGQFVKFCGPDMNEGLAKRLAVEFRAGGDAICDQIEHLERSISQDRKNLHPLLCKALSEACS